MYINFSPERVNNTAIETMISRRARVCNERHIHNGMCTSVHTDSKSVQWKTQCHSVHSSQLLTVTIISSHKTLHHPDLLTAQISRLLGSICSVLHPEPTYHKLIQTNDTYVMLQLNTVLMLDVVYHCACQHVCLPCALNKLCIYLLNYLLTNETIKNHLNTSVNWTS